MEAKKVFAIIIGVALLATAIGFIVTGNFFPHGSEARYNYKEVAYASEYEDVTASEGKYLEIVSVTIKNDNYGDGIDIVTLGWKITMDGLTFSMNPLKTGQLPDYLPCVIEKGRIWQFTIAFELPNANDPLQHFHHKDSFSMEYVYVTTGDDLRMNYDKNLHIPDGNLSSQYEKTVAATSKF